jgi:hypothetical protein
MQVIMQVIIPVSIGELFDKYTILQIKKNKILDQLKLSHVIHELNLLQPHIDKYNIDINLYNLLIDVNNKLWDIEDNIRIKEHLNTFDNEFIELARSVYKFNDERSLIKKQININFNSDIIEIKSYYNY